MENKTFFFEELKKIGFDLDNMTRDQTVKLIQTFSQMTTLHQCPNDVLKLISEKLVDSEKLNYLEKEFRKLVRAIIVCEKTPHNICENCYRAFKAYGWEDCMPQCSICKKTYCEYCTCTCNDFVVCIRCSSSCEKCFEEEESELEEEEDE